MRAFFLFLLIPSVLSADMGGVIIRRRVHTDSGGGGSPVYSADMTEDFNCANSTTLDCDQDWTEILGNLEISGNLARPTLATSDPSDAYIVTALSGADHCAYADIVINDGGGNRQYGGPFVRKSNDAAQTYYRGDIRDDAGTANRVRIFEANAGVEAELTSAAFTVNFGTTYRVGMCAQGNNLTMYVDGVQVLTTTDSTLATNVRVGIELRNNSGTAATTADNFEAGTFK